MVSLDILFNTAIIKHLSFDNTALFPATWLCSVIDLARVEYLHCYHYGEFSFPRARGMLVMVFSAIITYSILAIPLSLRRRN